MLGVELNIFYSSVNTGNDQVLLILFADCSNSHKWHCFGELLQH